MVCLSLLGLSTDDATRSESGAKALMLLDRFGAVVSECALVSLKVLPDFDSTMRRLESSAPLTQACHASSGPSASFHFLRRLPGGDISFVKDAMRARSASTDGNTSPCRHTRGVVIFACDFGIACRSTCASGIVSSTDSGTSAMPVPEETHATMAW